MPGFEKELLYQQLDNLQIQRHDFLNDFQVIKGYLQLAMPEKALDFIEYAINQLRPQQEIYMIGHKTVLAVLLSWYFELRLKGVLMEITVSPEMKTVEFWEKNWREEYDLQFYGYTKECSALIPVEYDPEQLITKIEFNTDSRGITCEFRLYYREKVQATRQFVV